MAQNFTYTELIALVPAYVERTDPAFALQIPTFIALAENRLATDMKQQGFQSVVKGNLPVQASMPKPSFWRETISFSFLDATSTIQTLQLRSLEYVKSYWPNQATTGLPRFYADYNATNFLLAATPSAAFTFELVYYARLQPLNANNQSNWLTLNAPQALLYAILLEACLWLKSPDKIAMWQAQYDAAKGSLLSENAERMADRNSVVTRA